VDFPGLKVGQIHLYSSCYENLVALILNRCGDTEYDYSWAIELAETVFPCPFCFLIQDLLNSSREEPLQFRPVFVPRNFVCESN
jgi:hypothetical protein